MATSNGQAVKAATVTALQTAFTGQDVSVTYGPPRGEMHRECVWVGKYSCQQDIDAGRSNDGNTTRSEKGTLNVHVRVYAPGDDLAAAEARALVLGAELEAYLTANTPNVTGLLDAKVEGYDLESEYVDSAVVANLSYTVATDSYIQ